MNDNEIPQLAYRYPMNSSIYLSFLVSGAVATQISYFYRNITIKNETSGSTLLFDDFQNKTVNPSLSIGGASVWSYAGGFTSQIRVPDYSGSVNSYLGGCSPYLDGSCDVPFTLYSSAIGSMSISAMNDVYDSQTYLPGVNSSQNAPFWVSVNSTQDITDVNATLIWNGVKYYPDSKSKSGNLWTFAKSIAIPSAPSSVPFQWNFTYKNATSTYTQNFTLLSESVTTNSLYNCTGGNTTIMLTGQSEEDWSPINYSMQANFIYGQSPSSLYSNFSFSYSGNSTYYVCLSPNTTSIYANAVIKYWNDSTAPRYYYLNGIALSSSQQNISLYMSNSSVSTQYLVQDNFGIAQIGEVIQAQRYFISNGTYINVVEGQTDANGYAYMNIVPSQWYIYLILKNGAVIKQFSPMYLNISQITLSVSQNLLSQSLSWYGGISYGAAYSTATHSLTCTIADSTGQMSYAMLNATQYSLNGSSSICSAQTTNPSTTLACSLPAGNYTFSYICSGMVGGQWWTFAQGAQASGGPVASRFGMAGLIAAFMLIMVLFFVGLHNPVVSIALGVSGLGISYFLGLINMTATSMISLAMIVCAGVIIAYRMKT